MDEDTGHSNYSQSQHDETRRYRALIVAALFVKAVRLFVGLCADSVR